MMYCRVFVESASDRTDLLLFLCEIFGGTIEERTLRTGDFEVDVAENDHNAEHGDFLYFRFLLDIVPAASVARSQFVSSVARLLRGFWDERWPAVAACDFEDELPLRGGVAAGFAAYRAIRQRDVWGAWDTNGYRTEDNPLAVDNAIWFSIFEIAGREIAVIRERVTPSQRDQLAATPLPTYVEAVVLIEHEPLDIDVLASLIAPSPLDGSLVATAAACGAASSGFGAADGEYRVRLDDAEVKVAVTFDDEDRFWSARCIPG